MIEEVSLGLQRRRTSQGTEPALSELRGLGPRSVEMLVEAGISTSAKLRKADLFELYRRIKAQHPRTSLNLLYAMVGAVDDEDWRDIAKERRSEILMRLDDMGLLHGISEKVLSGGSSRPSGDLRR